MRDAEGRLPTSVLSESCQELAERPSQTGRFCQISNKQEPPLNQEPGPSSTVDYPEVSSSSSIPNTTVALGGAAHRYPDCAVEGVEGTAGKGGHGVGSGRMDDLLQRAHELRARGEPFALATVVRAERPTSARPGMKAIVMADGTLEGWVGGSCAHPVVLKEATHSLRDGTPRLISLSPHRQVDQREGVIHHIMTCHSGGSLEIYIEPVLPNPQLLLLGEAPVVSVLAKLGRAQGFAVWVADAAGKQDVEADLRLPLEQLKRTITPRTYVVVATMGTFDEEALEQVVGSGAAYVALVASRKRAEVVFTSLVRRGVAAEHLQRVKVPAGLDIGAVTPEEIAVSIMAEIIQVRRSRPATPIEVPQVAEATDPICGMSVEVATARHTSDYQGVRFYFCCAQCKERFEWEPAKYAMVKG